MIRRGRPVVDGQSGRVHGGATGLEDERVRSFLGDQLAAALALVKSAIWFAIVAVGEQRLLLAEQVGRAPLEARLPSGPRAAARRPRPQRPSPRACRRSASWPCRSGGRSRGYSRSAMDLARLEETLAARGEPRTGPHRCGSGPRAEAPGYDAMTNVPAELRRRSRMTAAPRSVETVSLEGRHGEGALLHTTTIP